MRGRLVAGNWKMHGSRATNPALLDAVLAGVAGLAGVECAVPYADIRQAGGVVGTDWDISREVGHVVVNAIVPTQRSHREHIPETPHRVADAVRPAEWDGAARRCKCAR